VELHGGTVSAESAGPGAGATFRVVLPSPARAPSDALQKRRKLASLDKQEGEEQAPCLSGVRVLVVDDEADTRHVLRLTLEHAGAEVDTAASAAEAREAWGRAPPDVLLCDIGLGSEDGYALLRALRALPREGGGKVPAIALTGYARQEDRARALSAGFDLHL